MAQGSAGLLMLLITFAYMIVRWYPDGMFDFGVTMVHFSSMMLFFWRWGLGTK